MLRADRHYFVSPLGNDSQSGLAESSGVAFRTITRAIDAAYELDVRGHQVLIHLADGIYCEEVHIQGLLSGAPGKPLKILGNTARPQNVKIRPKKGQALCVSDYGYVSLAGVELNAVEGDNMFASCNALVEHSDCRFAPCLRAMISVHTSATVRAIGPTVVFGSAMSFVHATTRSTVQFTRQELKFLDCPVFSRYLWGMNDASLHLDQTKIFGTAKGGTTIHNNALMNVSSLVGNYSGGTTPKVNLGGRIADNRIARRTFYVGPDGDDTNDGLKNTAEGRFRSISTAINAVAKMAYDPLLWDDQFIGARIKIARGTYHETITLQDLKHTAAVIEGSADQPNRVVIIGVTDAVFAPGINTKWTLRGVKLVATDGHCIRAEQGSHIRFENVVFGSATGDHLYCGPCSSVVATGSYTIVEGAKYHARCMRGFVDLSRIIINLQNQPPFEGAFVRLDNNAAVRAVETSFSGAATGRRYDVRTGSSLDTEGAPADFFPGSLEGLLASGGILA